MRSVTEPLSFVLFVAGDGPNSRAARTNLAALCREHFTYAPEVAVVDVLADPERALSDGVLLTPQLLVRQAGRVRRVIGTLARPEAVLDGIARNGNASLA